MASSKKHFLVFVGILLLAIFFRFWHITDIPPGLYPDEAMNGSNALQALESGNFRAYYIDNNGREGLFINLQALAIWFLGNEAWVLRFVSAIFGIVAVWGIFLLTRELFWDGDSQTQSSKLKAQNYNSKLKTEIIALLSSFFLATSYWHVTLSRLGFRAITTPTFSILAFYFLFRGMRRNSMVDFALSGIMLGLGLNGYIAFRFLPFAFAVPVLIGLWRWWNTKPRGTEWKASGIGFSEGGVGVVGKENSMPEAPNTCFPCAVVLIGIFVIATCTPLIMYFTEHPNDFATRTGQVSVFADEHPLRAFAVSNIKTIGMVSVFGDCNSRHNFPCFPVLHPFLALGFFYGLFLMIKKPTSLTFATLLAWLFFLSLPATLTREGMPHALRSIGMIPPVMIIAAFGAYVFWEKLFSDKKIPLTPPFSKGELLPLKKGGWEGFQNKKTTIFFLLLVSIPLTTGYLYFNVWAKAPSTASAFSQDLSELAMYVRSLPKETKKYLIVELDHEGLPVSAQSVVYLTNTATTQSQHEHNVTYLPRVGTLRHITLDDKPAIIGFVAFHDNALEQELERAFPSLIKETYGGFTVYSYKP